MPNETPKGMMPIEEFSQLKGTSTEKIVSMIRDGFYAGKKIEEEWFISKDEIGSQNKNVIESPYKNTLFQIWFSFTGRLNFSKFWVQGTIIPWVLFLSILFFGAKILNGLDIRNPNIILLIQALQISIIVAMIWISLATTLKRLKDRSMSKSWYLLNFIPIVGPLILLTICCGDSVTVADDKI